MASFEISRPVRLLADLSAPPGTPAPRDAGWFAEEGASAKTEAVVSSGALFLQIGYPPAGFEGRFLDFVRLASSRGLFVSVLLAGGLGDLDALAASGAREVALDLSEEPDLEGCLETLREARGRAGAPPRTGALFRAGRRNLPELGRLLRAASRGADFVDLAPLALGFFPPRKAAGLVPGPEDYRRAAGAIEGLSPVIRDLPDLRVHDILLERIIRRRAGGRREGEGTFRGCQAAGSLGYLDPAGTVHPCISLHLPLGGLEDLPGGEPWSSAEAVGLRGRIAALEGACGPCPCFANCRGGCPAARLASVGSWEPVGDPLCAVFRELGR